MCTELGCVIRDGPAANAIRAEKNLAQTLINVMRLQTGSVARVLWMTAHNPSSAAWDACSLNAAGTTH
jgi:hypothetical protein